MTDMYQTFGFPDIRKRFRDMADAERKAPQERDVESQTREPKTSHQLNYLDNLPLDTVLVLLHSNSGAYF